MHSQTPNLMVESVSLLYLAPVWITVCVQCWLRETARLMWRWSGENIYKEGFSRVAQTAFAADPVSFCVWSEQHLVNSAVGQTDCPSEKLSPGVSLSAVWRTVDLFRVYFLPFTSVCQRADPHSHKVHGKIIPGSNKTMVLVPPILQT